MHLRAKPAPSVEVDTYEDCFEEGRDAFEGKCEADQVTELRHQDGPQESHLQAEHGAGHRSDGEQDGRSLGPLLGQHERLRVIVANPATMKDVHHRRERHAEARQDDVKTERQCHLISSGDQFIGGDQGSLRGSPILSRFVRRS